MTAYAALMHSIARQKSEILLVCIPMTLKSYQQITVNIMY